MKKYLVDTNVVLDLLMGREPYDDAAGKIFDAAYNGEIELYVCSLSYSNIFYIMRPKYGKEKTLEVLRELTSIVGVLSVNTNVIESALASDFKDFEDAIQYYSALQSGYIDGIITRNQKDFRLSEIDVLNPTEVLS